MRLSPAEERPQEGSALLKNRSSDNLDDYALGVLTVALVKTVNYNNVLTESVILIAQLSEWFREKFPKLYVDRLFEDKRVMGDFDVNKVTVSHAFRGKLISNCRHKIRCVVPSVGSRKEERRAQSIPYAFDTGLCECGFPNASWSV